MGVAVSSSHIVSANPSSSEGGLITLCPCSRVRSLPWDTVLCELLQQKSFPRAIALHKLLHCGSLPRGAVLQEHAAPAWVPHEVTSPASKPAPAWAPPHWSCQKPAPAWASHGVTTSFGHPPAPAWGPPQAAGGYLLNRGPPWASGNSLPHHGLLHGCRGISAPALGTPPPPPSSLTLVSAELFLSHLLTPLY